MKTVYLAGPINGCTDDEAGGWRDGFMARHPEHWAWPEVSGTMYPMVCTGDGMTLTVHPVEDDGMVEVLDQ